MASYNLISSFNVLIKDSAAGAPNFGALAVFTYHNVSPGRLVYDATPDGLEAMLSDGFTANSFAYRALSAAMQDVRVDQVIIYNRAAPNEQEFELTPTDTVEGTEYAFSVNDVEIEYTNGAAETASTIVDELVDQLGDVANATATDDATHATLEPTDLDVGRLYIKGAPSFLEIKDVSADAGIAADLAAGQALNSNFYGVAIDSTSEAEINAAAAWCLSNGKLALFQSLDSDILEGDETSVVGDLKAANNTRCGVFFSRDPGRPVAVALLSKQLARDPGRSNWENQPLIGIVADDLSGTEIANATELGACLFLPIGEGSQRLSLTHNIASAEGRFFDTTRDADYIKATAQAAVVTLFANDDNIKANQTGIDKVDAVVRARLTLFEAAGILDPGWVLQFPSAADLPDLKATRRLDASEVFAADFQGFINGADIGGSISAI